MLKRFYIVLSLLFLFQMNVNASWPHRRGKGVKWAVTAHIISLSTHAAYGSHLKSNMVSAGALGLLYVWDNLVHEYCEPRHRRNFYYILAGHLGGWFCGKQLRAVLISQRWRN